jgi:hypothetical protein
LKDGALYAEVVRGKVSQTGLTNSFSEMIISELTMARLNSPEQAHRAGAADPFVPPRAESLVTSHLRKRSRPP